MPWKIESRGGKQCVIKVDGGKVLHCYSGPDAKSKAKKYLGALYASEGKECDTLIEQLIGSGEDSSLTVRKQADGSYWITAVSTAAVKDKEGEIFTTKAMDWDIQQADINKDYPEFRVFHTPLGVGKVEKMSRAGIFAIDEGPSYTDPLSLQVCEKMLANNGNGKWRVSRGFYVHEVAGSCPKCSENLLLSQKHLVAGYKCPTCESVYIKYKGSLGDVRFLKARTFDVTVTDIPCVEYTGVSAVKLSSSSEEIMNKKQLKEKLLAAGIDAGVIDERLKGLSDERLKEFDDIPEAEVLKEFETEDEETEEESDTDEPTAETADDEQVFTLDPEVLKDFAGIVRIVVQEEVAKAMDGISINIDDVEMELKEVPGLEVLKEQLVKIQETLDKLTSADTKKLKESLAKMPRSGVLRIQRMKETTDEDVEEKEEEIDEEGVIVSADGKHFSNMSSFIGMGK